MRFAAFSGIAACIVGISCSLAPVTSAAQSCKCPKNPGPGGGVQCSKDQIATCDPSSGECNCVCDSVQPGKTKADYEAQIFSKVMHTKVDPADLSSRKYGGFVSSFRESSEDKGTFSFAKEAGAGPSHQVKVAVPEWLGEKLRGGVSIGPGGSATVNNNRGSIGGSLSAGPCSNVFNGGTNNQGTTNCELKPSWKLDQKKIDTLTSEFESNAPPGCVISVAGDSDSRDLAVQLCRIARVSNPQMPCMGPGLDSEVTTLDRAAVAGEVLGMGCYANTPGNPYLLAVQKALSAVDLSCEYKGVTFTAPASRQSLCVGGKGAVIVIGNMPAKAK